MKTLIRVFATDILGVSPGALSNGYSEQWRQDPRCLVVANGLPAHSPSDSPPTLRTELGVADDALLLMHVGRPAFEKNRPWAINVLHGLRTSGVDAHLVLIGGTGPDSPEVTAVASRLDVEPFVHRLGLRRGPRVLIAQADALVLTSVREGLPGVILEAISVGTPVVSADLPGSRFIAESLPGVTIVDDGRDAAAWARAVRAACDDARSAALREHGPTMFAASSFSIDRARPRMLALYRRTRGGSAGPALGLGGK